VTGSPTNRERCIGYIRRFTACKQFDRYLNGEMSLREARKFYYRKAFNVDTTPVLTFLMADYVWNLGKRRKAREFYRICLGDCKRTVEMNPYYKTIKVNQYLSSGEAD